MADRSVPDPFATPPSPPRADAATEAPGAASTTESAAVFEMVELGSPTRRQLVLTSLALAAVGCATAAIETEDGVCTCHAVCTCDIDDATHDKVMNGEVTGIWDTNGVCTCNTVCTCDTDCTCNTVCTCDSEGGSSGYSYTYYY